MILPTYCYKMWCVLGHFQQLWLEWVLRTYLLLSTWWLIIGLSPNVEPSTVLMAAIIFWFKYFNRSLSWSLLILVRISCLAWRSTRNLLKRPRKTGIQFSAWVWPYFRADLSLCAAILTELNSRVNLLQLTFRFTWPA